MTDTKNDTTNTTRNIKNTTRRTVLRWTALLGAAATAGALAVPTIGAEAPAHAADDLGSRFTLAVLPDTQFYSRYSADQFFPRYETDPFEVQTRWIVEQAGELNTAFTMHLGDVVDQEWVAEEWVAADRAMSVLEEGGMNYSVLAGNHDVANPGGRISEGDAANYLARFSTDRISRNETLVDTYQNGYSNAHVFQAEGQEFLVLAIGWNAQPSTWAWAQGVLDAHPTLPTIVTSHRIIDVDKETGQAVGDSFGDELWDELIYDNDQIFATLNGHYHGQVHRVQQNRAGNDVYQILIDSQMAADGGNGIMGLMEFDLSNDRLDFATVSPWVPFKDPETRTPSDTPVLTGPGADFSFDIDFAERFSFAEGFGAGDGRHPDLTQRAKDMLLDGWDGGDGTDAAVAAGNRLDYLDVPGTLAHWRFGDQADGVLPENAEITDETGDNPMYRLPVDQINAPAEVDDVTVTHANAASLSADGAAACFADTSRNTGKLNYLTTEYETPVTHAAFENGYTIESFVFLADEWTVEDNRWGGWLSRTGRRSALPVAWERYDYEMGPAFFSVSDLREFQWATTDGVPWQGTNSLWSGEIMTGTWYHVAAVNDPSADTTIMYVDGVPVLRNATNHNGMTFAEGYPWVIGTVFNHDEASNGWHGCVGETRIVDRPIDPDEFLTSRVDIDAGGANFSASSLPSGDLPAGTVISELSGTGFPGAQVRAQAEAPSLVTMALRQAAASAPNTTTVAEDGTWSITLDEPISAAGSHELSLVQSLGSRDGAPLTASFTIAADADSGPGETPDAEPGDGEGTTPGQTPGGAGDAAPGDRPGGSGVDEADEAAADGSDGALPATGVGLAIWGVLAAGLLALGVGWGLRSRRRAEHS